MFNFIKTEKTFSMRIVSLVYKILPAVVIILLSSCSTGRQTVGNSEGLSINVNQNGAGESFTISIEKGESHNHPTFAFWVEDMDENFIQTIFVTRSIATGIFGHGPLEAEKWDTTPGWQRRPAALPYWINKRKPVGSGPQLPDPDHPVPDAYTGATPPGNAVINTRLDNQLSGKIRVMMEVNQPWDWNDYWTNTLYDDPDYRTSCQPSLVYAVTVDLHNPDKSYYMNPIGHGHYSGKDGELYTDLTTISTAKDIFRKIIVKTAK
jgi:hypothetical protein